MSILQSNDATSGTWTAAQRDFVESQQESRYRALADVLKMGGDPRKAHAHFAGPPVPPEPFDSEKLRELRRRWAANPQTSYEDPNRYFSMALTFGALQEAFAAHRWPLDPRPLLATLPTGDISARIMTVPKSTVPVIFFEQGLFPFFYNFATLLGWATPPLSPEQLGDDDALSHMPRAYRMPFLASQGFMGALSAYVMGGSPINSSLPLPRPEHNLFTTITLLGQMERFIMAHELGHLTLGHLQRDPATPQEAWQQEYEADEAGARLVSELTYAKSEHWSVAFWACDLALTLFHILYRAIEVVQFGASSVRWISRNHPSPLARRAHLRERLPYIAANLSDRGYVALGELLGMSDAIVQRLCALVFPELLRLHSSGERPSPLWSDMIGTHMAAEQE